ncbi:Disease resistance protein TAO1 [Glycine soja]|uniref:Disease resistance protein TAO1 n=1 Tax=Glycine soja TaxID=3848 RepID=A0A445KF90_GLYSO|nr:Disease resistance protein TAO1 [Glycine soja]
MASKAIIQYSSSSSSSHAIITTYDVFVSFRGEDTRNNFTAFLFDALFENGIHAFKDDTHLQKGESIAPELLLAIQESRLFLVVFSKNYASSTWCLRELAHICNCTIEASPSRVLPIFYDVDPSELRKQSGYYGIAFAEHEERFREDKVKMEELQRCREALTQMANLSGWDIRNKSQPAMIKEIVQKINYILGPKFQNLPSGNLVGMESRVEELEKCLALESVTDVRVVGISGMGGIGKTTLALALYEKIAYQYDVHCFVDDVNKIYRHSGSLGVQKQLLDQCLNDKNLEICNVSRGTYLIGTRLRNKRGLIVLDNVSQVEQLHMFTGSRETLLRECLGGGSRIIITSRDEHILRTHGVNHVYRVRPLNQDNAVQLFCNNAFKCDYIMSDYKMLTHDALWHAQGHPLAIKVIGKSLFGVDVSQWEGTLVRLSENKSKNIMDVLRISYDALEEKDKEIFLDIACFSGQHYFEDNVKEILNFRGFNPEFGLQILVDKSLITISYGKIYMHDLLRDLGKCIVREKSPKEPRKWSRLWDCEDLYKFMSSNKEAKNLEAIVVEDEPGMFSETTMRFDALSKIKNLKLLILPRYYEKGLSTIEEEKFSGSLNYLSNELGYLIWHFYPFNFLPKCFQPHNLVELNLSGSNIQHLWDSTQPIPNLRRLNVSDCDNLIEVQDFGEALNLERLDLSGCGRLSRFHPSIGFPRNLTYLNLSDCKSLVELPHFEQALNLEKLNLGGCELLKQLPHPLLRQIHPSIGHLKKLTHLNLKYCKSLVNLPHFAEDLNLEELNLQGCVQLRQIHPSIGHLKKLTHLNLKYCKSLVNLPHFVGDLNLKELNLEGCVQLRQIHPSIGHLRKLTVLNLKDCKSLVSFPSNILRLSSLTYLSLFGCSNLHSIDLSEDSVRCLLPSYTIFSCMRQLDLSFCSLLKIPDAFGNLHSLEKLCLRGNNFETLPSLEELSKLLLLNLQHCKRLKYLPELPSATDWPMKKWGTVEEDEYGLGLNIFNCPELVDRDCCTDKCFFWMMQMVQLFTISLNCHPSGDSMAWRVPLISSIIPGSEIPRWFDEQHLGMGNVINIDISHFMQLDKYWIGITLSVIFVVHKERRMPPPDMEQRKKERPSLYIPVLFREDLVTDESDHLWLFYYPRSHFDVSNFDELKVVCRPRDLDYQDLDVEVKKYGYRWVYEHDLDLSNLRTMRNKNSSPRKRKYFTIEELETLETLLNMDAQWKQQ